MCVIYHKLYFMETTPGINLKEIPKKVFDIILDKQFNERKKKGTKLSLSQIVIILLKEAYCKEK